MKTLLIANENGKYEDKKGNRYEILCCAWVKGPRKDEFKDFDTLQEAIEYYELTEVEDDQQQAN